MARKVMQWCVFILALLGLLSPAYAGNSLTVSATTNQATYSGGDTVEITLSVAFSDGTPVSRLGEYSFSLIDGQGNTLGTGTLVKAAKGLFSTSYSLSAQAVTGSWGIRAHLKARQGKVEGEWEGTINDLFQVVEAGQPPVDPNSVDNDGDGYSVNMGDCNDSNPAINPAATEIVGNGIDENCNGMADDTATSSYTDNHYNNPDCLACHMDEAYEVHDSIHYQWQGAAPYMTNGSAPQGKLHNSVNSYCINILGDWEKCGACHVGKGAKPDPVASQAQLDNIDCLACHSEPGVLPTRADCLRCHAKAGGGDAVKRGDLALAHSNTTDSTFDVHMATTGANLNCTSCHTWQNHKVAGKGSDLRPTDLDVAVTCTNCHNSTPHDNSTINRHTEHVACQTCHIPVYAKDASDTYATEATETHRTWLASHSIAPPYHPEMTLENNLTPKYKFWNGFSNNYLLYDVGQIDPATGAYPTSRPEGSNQDGKLYPFKYKTAEQPMVVGSNQLIALDTSVFFATGDADGSVRQGLANMGMSPDTPYEWVTTDTYQLLNHEVSPSEQALQCADCHSNTTRMDLQGDLGYNLKADQRTVCSQCHEYEDYGSFTWVHDKHVTGMHYDCSWCHEFSRPERGLRMPR